MNDAPILFGTDGIRGLAGTYPLQKPFIRKLGAAAAAIYRQEVRNRKPLFLLGRDTRRSGPWIAQAFAAGSASEGIRVMDVGVTSTPSLAYLVPKRAVMGGVMVSASHNPVPFNGIKLFSPHGRKCPDAWERLIERRADTLSTVQAPPVVMKKDRAAVRDYLRFLRHTLPPRTSFKGMTIVVDCSHGALSQMAPPFLRSLGARVIAIGASPNGRNINAGWGSQHPERMRKTVLQNRADAGMAFDGDADRIILCDQTGQVLDGDYVLACAAYFLKEENRLPGNVVVVTVMGNLGLMKALREWGITPVVTPVGDRYVSEKLEECGGVLGGEQSGHVIFHDLLPTGDGLLTGLQVLGMLRRRAKPLSWVKTLFIKYPQVLENIQVRHKMPLEECPSLQAAIEEAKAELGEDGRVLVRYSGTEPLLRIMMEGPSQARLQALATRIAEEARKVLCHA